MFLNGGLYTVVSPFLGSRTHASHSYPTQELQTFSNGKKKIM